MVTKSNWGGAQRYVFDLATSIPQDKFEVIVACGDSRKKEGRLPGLLVQKLQKTGIKVIRVSSFTRDISIKKEFLAFKELRTILKDKESRPDIIHLNSSKAGGIGAFAARLSGIKKIIFTCHGLPWDEDRNILSRFLIFLASYMTFILCHKIILISKNNLKRVERLPFCTKKVVLIHNGIASINFKARENARYEIMGKPIKDVPWIGTIAEFTKNKGLSYLVEAASSLKKRGVAFRMSLIGDGEDLLKIKELAKISGLYSNQNSSVYIDLPGFVPDYARNLKASEIFVLPSVKEGLPYVLLEAGRAGLPVIASRVGGIPEIIEHNVSGILVPPRDPKALEQALCDLIKNNEKRDELGKNLKEKVEREFTLSQMVAKTKAIYGS